MQTHEDMSHYQSYAFMKRLHERSKEMTGKSQITAGSDLEVPLGQWQGEDIFVKQMPDDEQGILRISIGGGTDTPVPLNYCTFRGDIGKCISLLAKTLAALKEIDK